MIENLCDVLSQISALLRACDLDDKARWFEQRADALEQSVAGSQEFNRLVLELKEVIVGPGSFSDLPLIPPSGMTDADAREQQWELADALSRALEELSS